MKKLFAITLILSLSSCSYFDFLKSQDKEKEISFLEMAPKVDLKQFFRGEIESFAIIKDGNDKIIGSYTGTMRGEWDENKGVLKQNFLYNDGKRDNRTWLITDNVDGTFSAVGHDVVESETGKQIGNTIQMPYSFAVLENGVKQKIRYEDNFYLVDSSSMIGTSVAKSSRGIVISKSLISLKKVGK